MLSAATQANGTPVLIDLSIIARASWGLVAKVTASGTCAAARRVRSSAQTFGR
jgi:hypothetical protein